MPTSPNCIYGRHPVFEALGARPGAIRIIYLQNDAGRGAAPAADGTLARLQALAAQNNVPVRWLNRGQLEQLVGAGAVHQGVAAECVPFAYASLESLVAPDGHQPLLLLLDQVQDPHNVGALCRSALALGAHGLIIGKDRSAEVTAAVVKASAGATSHLPIARVVNISRTLVALKERGLWIVGTQPEGSTTPLARVDLTLPTVLVVGSEGSGMRPLTAKHCDVLTHIPIKTIGSLNASVAGAICLYEAARQRQRASFAPKP